MGQDSTGSQGETACLWLSQAVLGALTLFLLWRSWSWGPCWNLCPRQERRGFTELIHRLDYPTAGHLLPCFQNHSTLSCL